MAAAYVQSPTPEIAWQEPVPHWASPARREKKSVAGEHTRAQYLSPPVVWSAQVGAAVTESGTSEGHVRLRAPVQAGEQKSPSRPVT